MGMTSEKMLNRLKEFIRKLFMSLHTRDLQRGGWLSRYGFPVGFFYFVNLLALRTLLCSNLTATEWFPYFILIYVAVQLSLGAVMITSMVKAVGKGFLVIYVAIVVLVASWWLIINGWSPMRS